MPSKTINMHGKIYDLLDDTPRNKDQALATADSIRVDGRVAFLNPQKRKGQETNYWIYVADKTVRRVGSRKSISSKILLEEYKKGSESFGKFMDNLEKIQKQTEKELAINEEAKETPKKALVKNGKKPNGKKAPVKKNGKKNGKKPNTKK